MFSLDRRVSLGDEIRGGIRCGLCPRHEHRWVRGAQSAPRARTHGGRGMTMRMTDASGILGELKVKRTINAAGNMTLLGGSMLSSEVQAAMAEANETFVDMEELLDKSGKAIAEI